MSIALRYQMNMGVLSEYDLEKLMRIKVAVVGLGGLGGHVVNQLVRLGLRHLTIIDYDRFDETNLNRQLFSTTKNIGEYKVDVVSKALIEINPNIKLSVYKKKIESIKPLSVDYLIDCVDDKKSKIYLSHLSKQLNIPLLHGACGGWYGQVGWIRPQCSLIEQLYMDEEQGLEETMYNPPFIATVVASYMVSEFIKMIQGSENTIIDELLFIDLKTHTLMRSGDGFHG